MLKHIQIDLETYKLIESRRISFEESPNEIIKRVFSSSMDQVEQTAKSSRKSREGSLPQAIKRLLNEEQRPMHYLKITEEIINRGYWQTTGKTPEATVSARLSTDVKHKGDKSCFIRTQPGCYYLRENMEE